MKVCKIQTLSPRCLIIPLQAMEAVRIKSCLTQLFPFFLFIPTSVTSADSAVKTQPASAGDAGDTASIPGLGRSPWRTTWQPTRVFLLGKFRVQRSLVGCSPGGHERTGHDWVSKQQLGWGHICLLAFRLGLVIPVQLSYFWLVEFKIWPVTNSRKESVHIFMETPTFFFLTYSLFNSFCFCIFQFTTSSTNWFWGASLNFGL